jgi:hypothetical protein
VLVWLFGFRFRCCGSSRVEVHSCPSPPPTINHPPPCTVPRRPRSLRYAATFEQRCQGIRRADIGDDLLLLLRGGLIAAVVGGWWLVVGGRWSVVCGVTDARQEQEQQCGLSPLGGEFHHVEEHLPPAFSHWRKLRRAHIDLIDKWCRTFWTITPVRRRTHTGVALIDRSTGETARIFCPLQAALLLEIHTETTHRPRFHSAGTKDQDMSATHGRIHDDPLDKKLISHRTN